jgi:hypothetical protein
MRPAVSTVPGNVSVPSGQVSVIVRFGPLCAEQQTQDSCTFTQTSRFEVNGSASTTTGVDRLQFEFSEGCAFTDCERLVESASVRQPTA